MSWSRVCVDLAHHSRFFAWEKFLRVVVVLYVVVVYLVAVVLRVFLKVYLLPHNVF